MYWYLFLEQYLYSPLRNTLEGGLKDNFSKQLKCYKLPVNHYLWRCWYNFKIFKNRCRFEHLNKKVFPLLGLEPKTLSWDADVLSTKLLSIWQKGQKCLIFPQKLNGGIFQSNLSVTNYLLTTPFWSSSDWQDMGGLV